MAPKLQVVIASTRPRRLSAPVGTWAALRGHTAMKSMAVRRT